MTDTNIKIPIDTEPFITQWLVQNHYKTKSEIALNIYASIQKNRRVNLVLADAHFATEKTIHFFVDNDQNFLMKFPRNRMVDIEGQSAQLQNILRLRKNSRVKYTKGFLKISHAIFMQ